MNGRLVDLSVMISTDTLGPPSTNVRLELQPFHRGPGFWQVSSLSQSLHTGAHFDTPLHCFEDGASTDQVRLEDVSGAVALFDLDKAASEAITAADLASADPGLEAGQIAVLATGWSDAHFGDFPRFYVDSPYLAPDAAEWLVARRPKAVVFDFFEEYSARFPDFTSEDFVVHRILLGAGIYLVEQTTGLRQLKGQQATLFTAFIKLAGAEAAPARVFALLESE